MLDTKDLQLVHALVRAKSVRRAAELLRTHQSTLFRRLAALEAELGVRVFERMREGYALTPAGERMAQLAERMQGELDDLERELRGRDMRPSGILRVTTTDTLVAVPLTPIFVAFLRAYPGIELEVIASNQMMTLTQRDADVALRPSPTAPDNLIGKPICKLPVSLYASQSYVQQNGPIDDVGSHPWIGPDDSLAQVRWLRAYREQYPNMVVRYRINTVTGMVEAARHGLGIVPLPCYLGDLEASLVRVAPPKDFSSKLWLLTHPDLRHTARVRSFMDFIAAELSQCRAFLEGEIPRQAPAGRSAASLRRRR